MKLVHRLLKPKGIGVFQTVSTVEAPYIPPDPWFSTYIFPGGRLPRLEELAREMRAAGLTIVHVDNLRLHYAETVKKWCENLHRNKEKIAALSSFYDEKFFRMWNYYLQASESEFRYGTVNHYQILFFKGDICPLRGALDFYRRNGQPAT